MLTTYKVRMDLWKPDAAPWINAVQNDSATRAVALSVYENGQPWQIPDGVNVVASFVKADGWGGQYDAYPDGNIAWSVVENTITVGLVPKMLADAGLVKVSIALIQGDLVLQTFPIYLQVHESMVVKEEDSGDYHKIRGFLPVPQDAQVGQMLVVSQLSPTGAVAGVESRDCLTLTQETGSDVTAVMSQKAVTDALMKLEQIRPLFANNVDECVDQSEVYVLPDGYLYACMTRHIVEKNNEFDPDTAQMNYRINSSGSVVTLDGALLLPMVEMEMADPYTVNITGVTLKLTYSTYLFATYYDADGNRLGWYTYTTAATFDRFAAGNYSVNLHNADYAEAAYVRLWLGIGGNSVITAADVADLVVEFVPKSRDEYVTAWANTGRAFVPADYEDRIVELEEAAEAQKAETDSLRSTVLTLEDAAAHAAVPDYWQSHLEEKAQTILALQEAGGKDCFSFGAIADLHESANLGKCSGALANYLAGQCSIKYVLELGDTVTRSSVTSQQDMETSFSRAEEILKPIRNRVLQTRGNHDGCWDDDGTSYYIKDFAPQKLHSLIWRRVGLVPGVTSDDTGTAFYVDDPANRVRYILLNSHYAPYEENADGSAKYSSFRNARFGQAQYDWLVSRGLDVPAGWGIIVGCHVPLNDAYMASYGGSEGDGLLMRNLLAAYNSRAPFQGSFAGTMGWDAVAITADFTHATGEVIAAVAGHSHTDTAGNFGIPVITVRCDAAEENDDEAKAQRVRGTVSEQSFDIFTVNRSTRTIHITKIGAGEDRVIPY